VENPVAVGAPDLERLSDTELAEAADYAFWLELSGDASARRLLEDISRTFERRGRPGIAAARERASAVVWSSAAGLDRAVPFKSLLKMRQLLRLIVEHTLQTGEAIGQEELGQAYYGKALFTHQALAVEVGRLRKMLLKYYKGEGVADPLRIHVPKGRYIAVIRQMTASRRPAFLGDLDEIALRRDPRPLNALLAARGESPDFESAVGPCA
jgi:hypothetical protein